MAEAITLVRAFLDERRSSLDDVIHKTGFERNAAIVACKEAVNENNETRKRFEVMSREVFKKFKACINVQGVEEYKKDRDAINIIYKSLQEDREKADITNILRSLHQVVDEAIVVDSNQVREELAPYDISGIDFERLKREFVMSKAKNTTVQNLREAVERKLQKLLQQNPLRTNFQQHYEKIVADYNKEKDRATIEQTFESLLDFVKQLNEEENRALREGLDEESLAIFDLLKKPDLTAGEIKQVKEVAISLLNELKKEKLRVDQWREKEATRDAVLLAIHDYLWSDATGLPVESYSEQDVQNIAEEVYRHIYYAYPTVPSPYYDSSVA